MRGGDRKLSRHRRRAAIGDGATLPESIAKVMLKRELAGLPYGEQLERVRPPAPFPSAVQAKGGNHRSSAAAIAESGFREGEGEVPYRREMEESFGRDFSHVQAYTGASARRASAQLGAEAYTVGQRVAFRDPSPDKGVVAHELTHTLQQAGVQSKSVSSGAQLATNGEDQATAVERAVVSGGSARSVLDDAAEGDQQESIQLAPAIDPSRFGFNVLVTPESIRTRLVYNLIPPESITLFQGLIPTTIPIPYTITLEPRAQIFFDPISFRSNEAGELESGVTYRTQAGVRGSLGLRLGAGVSGVAQLYGMIRGIASGSGELTIDTGEVGEDDFDWQIRGLRVQVGCDFVVGLRGGPGNIVDLRVPVAECDIFDVTFGTITADDMGNPEFQWASGFLEAWQLLEDIAEAIGDFAGYIGAPILWVINGIQDLEDLMDEVARRHPEWSQACDTAGICGEELRPPPIGLNNNDPQAASDDVYALVWDIHQANPRLPIWINNEAIQVGHEIYTHEEFVDESEQVMSMARDDADSPYLDQIGTDGWVSISGRNDTYWDELSPEIFLSLYFTTAYLVEPPTLPAPT